MTSRTHTPADVQKIMEPWSPVSIGVDITEAGAHVVGIYALDNDTSQVFYAKFYPAPQRTWVGLTEDEAFACRGHDYFETYKAIETKLKEKNT